MRRRSKIALLVLLGVVLLPFVIPEGAKIPVRGATSPWGASGVHKGIDIFAPQDRPVISPVHGLVIFKGHLRLGGNVVAVLGPRWRIHYCAHLSRSDVRPMQFVRKGAAIGAVGTSGNAVGKAPHLHYAILSLFPRPWRISTRTQGWRRMFFVDPGSTIA